MKYIAVEPMPDKAKSKPSDPKNYLSNGAYEDPKDPTCIYFVTEVDGARYVEMIRDVCVIETSKIKYKDDPSPDAAYLQQLINRLLGIIEGLSRPNGYVSYFPTQPTVTWSAASDDNTAKDKG